MCCELALYLLNRCAESLILAANRRWIHWEGVGRTPNDRLVSALPVGMRVESVRLRLLDPRCEVEHEGGRRCGVAAADAERGIQATVLVQCDVNEVATDVCDIGLLSGTTNVLFWAGSSRLGDFEMAAFNAPHLFVEKEPARFGEPRQQPRASVAGEAGHPATRSNDK